MRIQPTAKQHLAWTALDASDASYIVYGGSAGSGKTWLECEWQLVRRIRYPGTRGFIGRNQLTRLMATTYLTLLKVHAHHGITNDMWKLNGQYHYIEYWNGSRIDLLDLAFQPSDPMYERLGSLECTDGAIDEAGEVDFMAVDILKSRLGRWKNEEYGLPPKMLLTCNPNKGWLYSRVYKPWRDGNLDPSWTFIPATYTDNPHTAGMYAKQLASIDNHAMRERLMYGNWDYEEDAGQLVTGIAVRDMTTNTVPSGEAYITADIARYGSDRAVIGVWDGWNVKLYVRRKKSTTEIATLIRDLEIANNVPRSRVLVDEDGVGGGVVDILSGCVGFMGGSSPLPDYRETKQNYANLKAQCGFMLAEKIQSHGVCVKNEDKTVLDELYAELEQSLRRKESLDKLALIPKDDVKRALGRSPDLADTLLMRAYFDIPKKPEAYVPKKNPITEELLAYKRSLKKPLSAKF